MPTHAIVHSNYQADWIPFHAQAERAPFAVFSTNPMLAELEQGDVVWLTTGIPNGGGDAYLCARLVIASAGPHGLGTPGFDVRYATFKHAAWADPKQSEYCQPLRCAVVQELPWWRKAPKSAARLGAADAELLEAFWQLERRVGLRPPKR